MGSKMATRDGWSRVRFGDLVRLVRDRVNPETSGLTRYVAGEHMDTDDLRIKRWGEIGDDYLGPAFHMRFKPGHVLYGSRRTYLRKVAVADFAGICANTTFVLESADAAVMLPELLPYVMQTEAFHNHSIKQSKGSVNPYVNFSDLAWYEFDLPSIENQQRLVRAMSAAQSAAQCHQEAGSALRHVALAGLASLIPTPHGAMPQGWRVRKLGEVARIVRGSSPRPKGDPRYYGGTVPRLMVEDITRDGRVVTPRIDFLTEAGAKLSRPLQAGTVVVVCSGCVGTPGILAVDACIHDGILGLPDLERDVDPDYLYFALLAAQPQFTRVTTKGGIWNNLTTAILKDFPISLPSKREQKRIADTLIGLEIRIRQCEHRARATQSLVARSTDWAASA